MRVVFILVVVAVALPARAQSLADIAAKEAARRATLKVPARVITDRDLPPDNTVGARASQRVDEGRAAASAPATKATTDDNGHDERWWNSRVDPLLRKLNGASAKLQAAKARAAATGADTTRSGSRARAATMRRAERAAAEVDRYTTEVAQARRALEDLEEEARKAGALPGWLRK